MNYPKYVVTIDKHYYNLYIHSHYHDDFYKIIAIYNIENDKWEPSTLYYLNNNNNIWCYNSFLAENEHIMKEYNDKQAVMTDYMEAFLS